MNYTDLLQLFQANVGRSMIRAPDNYPDWDPDGYADYRAELLEHWEQISSKIKRDTDKIPYTDEKLTQAIASFDSGDREPAQGLMLHIYSVLQLKRLR